MKSKLSLLTLAIVAGLSQGEALAQEQGTIGAEYVQKTKLYANSSDWNPGLNSGGDLDVLFNKIIPALTKRYIRDEYRQGSFVNLEFLGVYTINDQGEVNGTHNVYELDNLELVADQTMMSSFTNNTDRVQTWRPSSTYSRSSSVTTSTESNWGHDFHTTYGVSVSAKQDIPLIGSGVEVTDSFEVGYAYSKGGSNSQSTTITEDITVGSGGSYTVQPGETLVIQDMYGKSSAVLEITGRQVIFGEVGYRFGKTTKYGRSSTFDLGFGKEIYLFLRDWHRTKWSLLDSGEIGYSEFMAGNRLYDSFPHDEYHNPSVPTKDELDFLVQNSSAWTKFQDNALFNHRKYRTIGSGPLRQYIGVMEGTLTTVIEANSSVHSKLYSSNSHQGDVARSNMRSYKDASLGRNSLGLSEGNDLFSGTDGSDVIYPMTGSDIIHAGEGNDTIIAEKYEGSSNNTDIFYGQSGDDTIIQHDTQSHSTIYGGKGNDTLESKAQLSALIGGPGNDSFTLHETVQRASIRDEGRGETSHVTVAMIEEEILKVSHVHNGDILLTFENGNSEQRTVLLRSMYSTGEPILSIVQRGELGEKELVLTKEEVLSLADTRNGLIHFNDS